MRIKSFAIAVIGIFLFCTACAKEHLRADQIVTTGTEQSSLRAVALLPCTEIWAYLMQGEEYEIRGSEPITDLCYFAAGVTLSGNLRGPDNIPSNLKVPRGARTHLVIMSQNATLLHFVLDPSLPLRKRLIDDITVYSRKFSGVQIDFEDVNPDDRERFTSLVSDIKEAVGDKTLSVALPAKISTARGAYDFNAIGRVADRILVMAYDEHWNGSTPGPVASLTWCERVAKYAISTIPQDKLIMGVPFYGRSWQNKKNDRALKFRTTEQIMAGGGIPAGSLDGESPSFKYDDNVTVTVYYENASSITGKVALYRRMGVTRVGFWRLGQEPGMFWDYMSVR